MATAAATAARAGPAARRLGGLSTTRFGYGAYRVGNASDEDAAEHYSSLRSALQSGAVNVIDTSTHYFDGGSEKMVGAVLEDLCVKSGEIDRESIVVVTKVGHVSKAQAEAGLAPAGAVGIGGSGAARHSLDPSFIASEIERSSERLGTVPDIVLLHNPEFLLTASPPMPGLGAADAAAIRQDRYLDPLTEAFASLESQVAAGNVGHGYGVSTNPGGCWWSVSGRPNRWETTSVEAIIECAKQAAAAGSSAAAGAETEHNLCAVQLPLNMLELGGAMGWMDPYPSDLAGANSMSSEQILADNGSRNNKMVERPSALRACKAAGVSTMANRPLNTIPPRGVSTGDWGRGEKGHLRLVDMQPASPFLRLLRQIVIETVQSGGGGGGGGGSTSPHQLPSVAELEQAKLSQLALWVAASTPNVDVTLSGARRLDYVEDLQAVNGWPALEEQQVWQIFDRVQDCVEEMSA